MKGWYFVDGAWLHISMWFTYTMITSWKHFGRYWSFVRRISRSQVKSPQKGQWRGALVGFLICAWINGWVNNREAGDLRRHRAPYEVIVMQGIMIRVVCAIILYCVVPINTKLIIRLYVRFYLQDREPNYQIARKITGGMAEIKSSYLW